MKQKQARKALRCLKGTSRFRSLVEPIALTKQSFSALDKIHFWSKIQSEIRTRRHWMVAEGRIKQKKLENQVKIDSKLHELEVEWCGGPETMDEIVSRIQQREEATNKRERAMAYAFYHQVCHFVFLLHSHYYNICLSNVCVLLNFVLCF